MSHEKDVILIRVNLLFEITAKIKRYISLRKSSIKYISYYAELFCWTIINESSLDLLELSIRIWNNFAYLSVLAPFVKTHRTNEQLASILNKATIRS